MTALISVYNSGGCVGRCDVRCYDAEHPECDCICRGRNHGKGRDQAEANARELAQTWIEYAERLGGLRFDRVELDQSVTQDRLF